MTIIYRETDPISGRWTANSGGIDLSAFQIDQNFYECVSRIATLESNESFTVSIDFITMVGNELKLHNTKQTVQGPYTIPVAAFRDRGAWQPFTAYSINDVFSINGTLYLVTTAFTSGATFSVTGNISALLSLPGNSLPTGGATGQALKKSSSTDFAATWGGWTVPDGGATGQRLAKSSNTNGDTFWTTDELSTLDDVALSSPHSVGQFLQWNGSHWANVTLAVSFSEISSIALGSPLLTGQVLAFNGTIWTNTTVTTFDPATTAQYLNDTASKGLTTDVVWAAADLVTLTDASTIAVDMSTFINADVLITANRTLGNPTNTKNGQTGFIEVIQDSTGSRTLAYGSNYKFAGGTPPVLSTAANARDLLYYQVITPTFIYLTAVKDVK